MIYVVGTIPNPYTYLNLTSPTDPSTGAGFAAIINNLTKAIVALSSIALFINLLMGGFRYLTSEGDVKAVDSAKKMITSSLVGMAIVGAAFFLALMIKAITGFDITSITIGG